MLLTPAAGVDDPLPHLPQAKSRVRDANDPDTNFRLARSPAFQLFLCYLCVVASPSHWVISEVTTTTDGGTWIALRVRVVLIVCAATTTAIHLRISKSEEYECLRYLTTVELREKLANFLPQFKVGIQISRASPSISTHLYSIYSRAIDNYMHRNYTV